MLLTHGPKEKNMSESYIQLGISYAVILWPEETDFPNAMVNTIINTIALVMLTFQILVAGKYTRH